MKHIITFEDGEIFEEDALQGTWNEMPNKQIQKWEYQLDEKRNVVFENFEAYNHILKHGMAINHPLKGLIAVYLVGRYENKIRRVILDVRTNKVKSDIVEIGKEYNEKAHPGWKKGVENKTPQLYFT